MGGHEKALQAASRRRERRSEWLCQFMQVRDEADGFAPHGCRVVVALRFTHGIRGLVLRHAKANAHSLWFTKEYVTVLYLSSAFLFESINMNGEAHNLFRFSLSLSQDRRTGWIKPIISFVSLQCFLMINKAWRIKRKFEQLPNRSLKISFQININPTLCSFLKIVTPK